MGKHEKSDTYITRLKKFEEMVSVYPVSCERLAMGRNDFQWLDAVLEGGAKIVQLRSKTDNDSTLLEKARYFRRKTAEAGALFIVNDRVDIALLSDADGVHVGQNDLPPAEIRKIGPDLIIGLSCNSRENVAELAAAGDTDSNPVSYFNIGPLYPTKTKEGLKEFLGIDAVREFSRNCTLPFTVMGGIKDCHIEDLAGAGVRKIAVVTAISKASDMKTETARWMNLIVENYHE